MVQSHAPGVSPRPTPNPGPEDTPVRRRPEIKDPPDEDQGHEVPEHEPERPVRPKIVPPPD